MCVWSNCLQTFMGRSYVDTKCEFHNTGTKALIEINTGLERPFNCRITTLSEPLNDQRTKDLHIKLQLVDNRMRVSSFAGYLKLTDRGGVGLILTENNAYLRNITIRTHKVSDGNAGSDEIHGFIKGYWSTTCLSIHSSAPHTVFSQLLKVNWLRYRQVPNRTPTPFHNHVMQPLCI